MGIGSRKRSSGRAMRDEPMVFPSAEDAQREAVIAGLFDGVLRSARSQLLRAESPLAAEVWGSGVMAVWDGLPAHRSKVVHTWLRQQRSWLVVEPLPGYAPDLNPVEGLWSSLKGVELANLAGERLDEVIAAAQRGIQRIRHTHHLAFSFLRYCGLSLW